MRNETWIARQSATPEDRREYEEERLIALAFEHLAEAMEKAELTKADIAKALGTSRAHITQVMSGQRNPTLRTVASLAWACGFRATLEVEPLRQGEYIDLPACLVRQRTDTDFVVQPKQQGAALPEAAPANASLAA